MAQEYRGTVNISARMDGWFGNPEGATEEWAAAAAAELAARGRVAFPGLEWRVSEERDDLGDADERDVRDWTESNWLDALETAQPEEAS